MPVFNWAKRESAGAIAMVVTLLLFPDSTEAMTPAPAPPAEVEPAEDSLTQMQAGDALFRQGQRQYAQGKLDEALGLWQQALERYRSGNQAPFPEPVAQRISVTLGQVGRAYQDLGQPGTAIGFYNQALSVIEAALGSGTARLRLTQVIALTSLGEAHRESRQYETAIGFYHRQLSAIAAAIETDGDSEILLMEKAIALRGLGIAHRNLNQYSNAIGRYEQQIALVAQLNRTYGPNQRRQVMAANATGNLGIVYRNLGQYDAAVGAFKQQLQALLQAGSDEPLKVSEARARGNLGNAYSNLGQYSDALAQYEQQLAIARALGEGSQAQSIEARASGNLGIVYRSLGQYEAAIAQHERQRQLSRALGDPIGEAAALGNLGVAFREQGQYDQAIAQYQQQQQIARTLGDRASVGTALANIGNAYREQGQHTQAIAAYHQSLELMRQIGDRRGEALVLGNLGIAYGRLDNQAQAFVHLQQALFHFEAIKAPAEAAKTLSELGQLLVRQNRDTLAIVFYKAAVNRHEQLRRNLDSLPQNDQQTFVESVADDYRALADLLLQSNRLLEAQAVLDQLKVQELDDYLQNVRSGGARPAISYWEPEQRIFELYQATLVVEEELRLLQDKPYDMLTAAERDRLLELTANQNDLFDRFDQFLTLPDVEMALIQLRQSSELIDVENLVQLQNNLANLDNAVLLYPLVLPDRLELLLVTPYSPPLRYPVTVTAAELNQGILAFRQALTDPQSDAITPAQQLYDWLLSPLEEALDLAQVDTLVYAPDGPLRYIPLAALHDGDRWVAERFQISHITAASLTDFDTRPPEQLRVLAAACAVCSFSFEVGERQFQFQDLPFTTAEVETLAAQIPQTDTLIDRAFSPAEVSVRLGNYTVLHLATHAAFVSGQPDESFIVFGNGERATLRDIRRWNLRNVDLVVLSACETAVGETNLGNGTEILGFGYQMQRSGANTAIASLWQVNDQGTQVLMNAFYTALQEVPKAEALRQAQLTLIQGTDAATSASSRAAEITLVGAATGDRRLTHPYYWAPFILIGNGL